MKIPRRRTWGSSTVRINVGFLNYIAPSCPLRGNVYKFALLVSLVFADESSLFAQSSMELSVTIAENADGNQHDLPGSSAVLNARANSRLALAEERVSGRHTRDGAGELGQARFHMASATSEATSEFFRGRWNGVVPGIESPAFVASGVPAVANLSSRSASVLDSDGWTCVFQDSCSAVANKPIERFHWGPALLQSFEFSLEENGFRLATDYYARLWFLHKPFWHDWLASTKSEVLTRWGDGDDFMINYIGHPLQGAVSGYIQIQNDPRGRDLRIGRSSQYWKSRLKATAWSAVYSAQFEAGPILSETAIGNVGGNAYTPPGKPRTNGTGLVDFVVTPVIGLGWILLEDTLDKYLVDRLARNSPALKYKILRGALSPARTNANMLQGKVPWYRYSASMQPSESDRKTPAPERTYRREIGWHYANVNLPMDLDGCFGCRVHNSGLGVNLGYGISRRFAFDSEFNFFPGSWGNQGKSRAVQGLVGLKYGFRQQNWGVFAKLRPGFVYYEKARPQLDSQLLGNLTRFAFDVGGILEYYPSRHSTVRLDIGTTMVRYLKDNNYLDGPYPLSTRDFITQGNFQFATGYVLRF